jgi:hypothetical protein
VSCCVAIHASTVPPGAVVMELKTCENCGCAFARRFAPTRVVGRDTVHVNGNQLGGLDIEIELRRGQGSRYCKECVGRSLMPNLAEQEEYRDQFPGSESQMDHRSMHLPRYDDSLLPPEARGKFTQAHKIAGTIGDHRRKRCSAQEMMAWKQDLVRLFAERGSLSCEDMQGMIPRCYTPKDAYMRVIGAGFKLAFVKYGERISKFGRPPKIFRLAEMIQ